MAMSGGFLSLVADSSDGRGGVGDFVRARQGLSGGKDGGAGPRANRRQRFRTAREGQRCAEAYTPPPQRKGEEQTIRELYLRGVSDT